MKPDRLISKLTSVLKDFLEMPLNSIGQKRLQVVDRNFTVYLRYGRYVWNGQISDQTLTIAAIGIDEKYQGKGVFKAFLAAAGSLTEESAIDQVVIECVNNPDLARHLEGRGFTEDPLRPTNYVISAADLRRQFEPASGPDMG